MTSPNGAKQRLTSRTRDNKLLRPYRAFVNS
jgi:hypothetical protein